MKFYLFPMAALLLAAGVQSATADCGYSPREIKFEKAQYNLEVGDTLQLTVTAKYGGGCAIKSAKGVAYWGDGTTSILTSVPNTPRLTGTHPYKQSIPSGAPIKVVISGEIWNSPGVSTPERLSSDCDAPGLNGQPWQANWCNPQSAQISVFDPMRPASAVVVNPVHHGSIAKGALAISLEKAAPASDMRVTVDSTGLKIGDSSASSPVPPGHHVVIKIPAGTTTYNVDIDAKDLHDEGTHVIKVSNAGKIVTAQVKVH